MDGALGYREQGYSFDQIAKQMKVSRSTAHGYVVEGMNAIPLESAKAVLAMELKRLDSLLSAFYANATEGDLAAAGMALNIIEKRCKLLGLFSRDGATTLLLPTQSGDVRPQQEIVFVVPGTKPEDEEQQSPVRGPQPPFPWQRQLPKPVDVPMFRDPLTGAWRSGPTE
jgi:hypothetical protein